MQNTATFDLVWPGERRSRKQKEIVRALENEAPLLAILMILAENSATRPRNRSRIHYLIFPMTLIMFSGREPSIQDTVPIIWCWEAKVAEDMDTLPANSISVSSFRGLPPS